MVRLMFSSWSSSCIAASCDVVHHIYIYIYIPCIYIYIYIYICITNNYIYIYILYIYILYIYTIYISLLYIYIYYIYLTNHIYICIPRSSKNGCYRPSIHPQKTCELGLYHILARGFEAMGNAGRQAWNS